MANQVVELKCFAEKKTFVDPQTGTAYPYWSMSCIVNNQQVKLSVPKESKALLNYLLDSATSKS